MNQINLLKKSRGITVYAIHSNKSSSVYRYLVSTPETRAICNDPFLVGVAYTNALKRACIKTLKIFSQIGPFSLSETNTTVLHILRGGLNFGLREAFNEAFGWNLHFSAFISSQRARRSGNMEDWHITEGNYQKVYLAPKAEIVFGDVVATGTSLEFALKKLLEIVEREGAQVRSVFFFTIGGIRAEEILIAVDQTCRNRFKEYIGSIVVYFEGRFGIAFPDTDVRIKITGTDLLRKNGLYTPEFVMSQYENPAYPLERCAIYDAGSRAFWLPEYLEDVWDYWEQTLWLAKEGVTFAELLNERTPYLDPKKYINPDLKTICQMQIARCEAMMARMQRQKPAFKKE